MYLEAIDVPGVVPRDFPLVGRIGCPEITSAASTTEIPRCSLTTAMVIAHHSCCGVRLDNPP
ncbi:hypothetical protein GM730_13735 [Salmonella enterica]|nr:hypothetical protein [Salmonella enterica]EEF1920989.1 hypothetical protein [Salmonella enterica]EEI0439091.1 hypothetical protein [Salmonella enterica]EEI8810989.1 hypothetical protein [Salmonella enterica]EEJ5020711.1 hypothetical protein [Salmonella enterica]